MNSELIEYARKHCNEEPEKNKIIIANLIEWIRKTPHLRARTNKRLILAFLRRSHFNLDDAKIRIDAYYSFKNHFPEVLRERFVDEAIMELTRTGIHIIPLKPISLTGPRLVISRFSKCDPAFLPRQIFKLFFMLLEILSMESNNATVCGINYIVDLRDVPTEQMLQYDSFLVKKMWMFVEHGMPLRFNEIHIINMRREGQPIYEVITNVLPKKRPFKLIVHQKAEELYRYVPRDAMTIEYGGHNGFATEAIKIWTQKLMDHKDYFTEDDSYGTNEKLRAGLANRWNENRKLGEGISGSFRKIQAD